MIANRRTFLFGALAAALPTAARAAVPERVRLGIIGVGGQGEYNWSQCAAVPGVEIVALCDVDLARMERARQQFPGAAVTQDFRGVLDRRDVDAVVVSTPDHWHALASIRAMQAGKHVYCEKPLARSVHEVRMMRDTARRTGAVTQMGTQIHAGDNYRRVVELLRAGVIGNVNRVDVWCDSRPVPGRRLAPGAAVPPTTLDYDLWVGPAQYVPFNPAVVPFHWRWWWEFGGGVLADMACHYMDLPHWALGLRRATRIVATGTPVTGGDNTVPEEMKVVYTYPAEGRHPNGAGYGPVTLTWYHGVTGPRDDEGRVLNLSYSSGVLFHGEQGQLLANYGAHRLLPAERFRDIRRPDPTLPASIGHHREWIEAIRGGGNASCEFEYASALTETVLLGNISYRLSQPITWDPVRTRVRGVPERAWRPLVRPAYRDGWDLGP